MPSKKKPLVSILILHVNGEKILDNVLKSLKKTKYNNFETLLLLNGTTDNSLKIARKYDVDIDLSTKI